VTAHRSFRLEVWTGGQTGVDRAGFDAALELGIPIAGWVPKGRLAEGGPVPARYAPLHETESPDYAIRTRLNVQETDATLVFTMGASGGGTLETIETARRCERPLLVIDLDRTGAADAAAGVSQWLETLFTTRAAVRLNIAGPRASQAPAAYAAVREVLRLVLAPHAIGVRTPDGFRSDRAS
jgi:hypothetical protein